MIRAAGMSHQQTETWQARPSRLLHSGTGDRVQTIDSAFGNHSVMVRCSRAYLTFRHISKLSRPVCLNLLYDQGPMHCIAAGLHGPITLLTGQNSNASGQKRVDNRYCLSIAGWTQWPTSKPRNIGSLQRLLMGTTKYVRSHH